MPDLMQTAGWVLIHFVWQGAILGALAWFGCMLLKRSSGNARYLFLCGALFLCGLCPALTWIWLVQPPYAPLSNQFAAPGFRANESRATITDPLVTDFVAHYSPFVGPPFNYIRISETLREWIPTITHIWVIGVGFLTLKFAWEYFLLGRLNTQGPVMIAEKYVENLASLAKRMGIQKSILLVESSLVEIPTVMGWLKPVLIVPTAFFTSLPADQIQAIFAHELAHVRRYDYCVNLGQVIVETVLFYHPVVWWIGGLIRQERENCCDDMAIAILGNKITYVSALATFERGRIAASNVAMAADGGSLLKRVQRVFGGTESDSFSFLGLLRESYKGMVLGILMTSVVLAACFASTRGAITRDAENVYLAKALVAASQEGDLVKMENLLRQGADPDANVRPTGYDALYNATTHNQTAAIKLLLRYGARIDGENTSGQSPLDWALAAGNLPMATLLRDNGAKISPEAWAGATGDVAKLKALVDDGTLIKGKTGGIMKRAVSMGQMGVVRFLEYFEGKPIQGKLLSAAASSGNLVMMSYILDQGAANKADIEAAMEQAVVFYDQPEAAKLLLAHGADPNRYTRWDKYILCMARSARMVKVLLEAGANPSSEDINGNPLGAVPNADSVKLLFQHGANLNRMAGKGSIVEEAIIQNLYDRPDVIEELRTRGATLDPKTNGVGALAMAVQRNDLKTIKYLLKLGVDPSAYSDETQVKASPLCMATLASSLDVTDLLLASSTARGSPRDGFTPLSLALLSRNWDVTDLLRKAGARDVCDLSIAASFGDVEEVSALIDQGADVNEPDKFGHTPLFYAKSRGRSAVIRLLLQHGAKVNDSV